MKIYETSLNIKVVDNSVDNFPNASQWEVFECSRLKESGKRERQWKGMPGLEKEKSGNYAFLLPAKYFKTYRTIKLSGPVKNKKSQKILFRFKPQIVHIKALRNRPYAVLYVGKTSKLKQRFQWHFSPAETNTGAQMQNNISICGLRRGRKKATRLMGEEGVICYRILDGYKEAANREMIEVRLWAKFNAPFNIKSER